MTLLLTPRYPWLLNVYSLKLSRIEIGSVWSSQAWCLRITMTERQQKVESGGNHHGVSESKKNGHEGQPIGVKSCSDRTWQSIKWHYQGKIVYKVDICSALVWIRAYYNYKSCMAVSQEPNDQRCGRNPRLRLIIFYNMALFAQPSQLPNN